MLADLLEKREFEKLKEESIKLKQVMIDGDNSFALTAKANDCFKNMMKTSFSFFENGIIMRHINQRLATGLRFPAEAIFKIPTDKQIDSDLMNVVNPSNLMSHKILPENELEFKSKDGERCSTNQGMRKRSRQMNRIQIDKKSMQLIKLQDITDQIKINEDLKAEINVFKPSPTNFELELPVPQDDYNLYQLSSEAHSTNKLTVTRNGEKMFQTQLNPLAQNSEDSSNPFRKIRNSTGNHLKKQARDINQMMTKSKFQFIPPPIKQVTKNLTTANAYTKRRRFNNKSAIIRGSMDQSAASTTEVN